MRVWHGGPYAQIQDPAGRSFAAKVDYFLRDLGFAIHKIANNQTPDGAADPIVNEFQGETPGSVLFVDTDLSIAEDNPHLFWADSTNRLGVGTNLPTAILEVTQPALPPALPSGGSSSSIGAGPVGAATVWECVDDPDADTGGTDYIRWDFSSGFNATVTLTFDNVGKLSDPGTDTGFVIHITMRTSTNNGAGPTFRMGMTQAPAGGSVIFTDTNAEWGNTGYTGGANQGNITASLARYTYTLSDAQCALIDWTKQFTITIRNNGLPASGTWDVSQIEFVGGSGASAPVDLQHWAGSTTIKARVDSDGKFGLNSATPAARLHSVALSAGEVPMIVEGAASQTADLFRARSSTPTTLMRVSSAGIVQSKGLQVDGSTSGTLSVNAAATTTSHTLTMPSAQGAADTVLKNDGAGALTWSTISSLGGAFVDSTFRVIGSSDATKKLAFEVDGFTTATTRTVTPPNASGTMALIDLAQTFTKLQTITADSNVTSLRVGTDNTTRTANAFEIFDGNLGQATVAYEPTTFDFRVFSFSFWPNGIGTDPHGSIDATAITSTNKTYTLTNASGRLPLAAASLALAPAVLVGDDPPAVASGNLGKVDSTGLGADVGSTNLSNTPPSGLYRVSVVVMTTTAGIGAGTIDVTIAWTDNVGATTQNAVTAHNLAATGRTSGSVILRRSSGNIAYTTTATGGYGAGTVAVYALYIRVEALG